MADALSVRHRARRSISSRSGDADRGAAAVEFAILLPVFLMLAFGTLTGGQAYAHKIGLTQAAREGARYGATLPIPPIPGQTIDDWLSQVRSATLAAAADDFTVGQDSSSLCVAFINGQDATKDKKATVDTAGNMTSPVVGNCWDDTALGMTDNRVQVVINRQVEINIGLTAWHPMVTTRSVIHSERA
jgi:Flp pilus assembly protein TadG